MSNHNEISSFIWRVCDDELRGLFKPHEYGDIILPFVVLRRLDCLIEPHKDEVVKQYNELLQSGIDDPTPIIKKKTGLNFFNYSPYDLTRLKSDPNGLKINFPNYVNGYSDNVHQILENFQLEKPVEKLIKNKKLYSLIDKFTEVDLHPNKIDNHTMGSIFEELLRKFSEMSNETSGEHYTPRDVVKLLVSMVFSGDEDNLKGEGIIRSIFDPCCGTGGMLTIGKEWVNENISSDVMFQLYGQELNPQTFSICKSDFLITGEDPERIKLGTSLSNDQHEGRTFDYMITNPPFGVSWKSEKDFVIEESKNPMGRFSVGTPRTSDGSLLFLQHMISKRKPEGSRIGVVFNGSPLFTGDSGSGESEIRKWIIENDWLECIVSLPTKLFFNTGIQTYLWIVSNKKKPNRKGKIQLIDGSIYGTSMRKNLGEKSNYITEEDSKKIIKTYQNFEENEYSKIFENEFFGYTKITIERPLKENGVIERKKDGTPKPDSKLRDYERVPLSEDIEEYFSREVEPHLLDSWIDFDKNKVGYEINFTKYFYQYNPLRSSEEITNELLKLEEESQNLLNQVVE
jgi:type I restriction enzyme M protein